MSNKIEVNKDHPNVVHGHSRSRHRESKEYNAWMGMRRRCNSPTFPKYKTYGARGIKVCDKWNNSFINFFEDMGYAPSPFHSLDRIDVNGNYCPENCRWATLKEQANNKRSNLLITYNGKTQNLAQWAEELGLKYTKVLKRIKWGWTIQDAFTLENQKGNGRKNYSNKKTA